MESEDDRGDRTAAVITLCNRRATRTRHSLTVLGALYAPKMVHVRAAGARGRYGRLRIVACVVLLYIPESRLVHFGPMLRSSELRQIPVLSFLKDQDLIALS